MRVYSVPMPNLAMSVTRDWFELAAATNKPCRLMGFSLDNVGGTADAGDAQEEFLSVCVFRGYTTPGSGGFSVVPVPLNTGDAAASFTAKCSNTTYATGGTPTQPWVGGWNVRVPLREFWPEEMWIGFGASDVTCVVRLLANPADALNVSATVWVAEGG